MSISVEMLVLCGAILDLLVGFSSAPFCANCAKFAQTAPRRVERNHWRGFGAKNAGQTSSRAAHHARFVIFEITVGATGAGNRRGFGGVDIFFVALRRL
jgi:hypothetical protein